MQDLRRGRTATLAMLVTVLAACGADTGEPAAVEPIASPSSVRACVVPSGVSADGAVEGQRGEALVELLTGIDETAILEEDEGVDIVFDDPNFGGVWGDRRGGWVVAVIDCSPVDVERVAALAGGSDRVRVIEVAFSFEEINEFRDQLWAEIRRVGVAADVGIDSTLDGRLIRIVVEDPSQLPDSFGDGVPPSAFVIERGEISTNANG